MKRLILITMIFSMYGCDIQKEASKTKTETEYQEDYEYTRIRKGDSVVFIPQIKYVDTTIYTVNRQGTTLRTVYDKQGNMQSSECFASMIEEIFKGQVQLQQSTKEKDKAKTEEFDSSWVLYLVGGVVFIVCFIAFFVIKSLNQNAAAMKIILERLK